MANALDKIISGIDNMIDARNMDLDTGHVPSNINFDDDSGEPPNDEGGGAEIRGRGDG